MNSKKLRALRSRLRVLGAQGHLEPDQVTDSVKALERAERAARDGDRKAFDKALGEIASAFLKLPIGGE